MLWPAAVLLHLAANPQHLLALDTIGSAQFGVVALAAGLVVRPDHRLASALAALHLLVFWLKLPVVGNHEVLLALMAVAVLASGRRSGPWLERTATAWRAGLVVAYGFMALSKLNHGFLDPAVSCAGVIGDELGGLAGLPPGAAAAVASVAWVTIAVETAIPILLVVRRWRAHGVVLALAFHMVLALDPRSHIWDFSSTLLALFVLFGPAAVHHRLDRVTGRWRARPLGERVASIGLAVAVQGLALVGPLPDWFPAYPAWLALGGGALALAAGSVPRPGDPGGRPGPRSRPIGAGRADGRWRPAVILVVALALANGLAPYAEVRTAAAFNMYSNLRVIDGRSNHLIVPALPVWERGSMVATSPAGDPAGLGGDRGAELLVPIENLERLSGRRRGLVGLIEHKLAFRRSVPAQRPDRCLRAWGPMG